MTDAPEILIDDNHVYTVADGRHPPSVTGIMSALGFVDLSMIPPDKLEIARVRGVATHDAIQFLEENDLDWDTVSNEIRPYLDAFLLFREQTGYRSRVREQKLFCPALFYCGRLDAIGGMTKLGIEEALLDYKTGIKLKATRIQTAAYGVAIEKPLIPRYSLHLKKTGKYELVSHKDNNESWAQANHRDYNDWRCVVRTYHIKRELNGGKL